MCVRFESLKFSLLIWLTKRFQLTLSYSSVQLSLRGSESAALAALSFLSIDEQLGDFKRSASVFQFGFFKSFIWSDFTLPLKMLRSQSLDLIYLEESSSEDSSLWDLIGWVWMLFLKVLSFKSVILLWFLPFRQVYSSNKSSNSDKKLHFYTIFYFYDQLIQFLCLLCWNFPG